ncbi:hypothetical protein CYMTET_51730 [Cymbomonas tetramitiformis]|uniref:Patatin n=1 Tax=Cymbomonas tetramitiformis TaxID=36881 RepID=A0AAE0BMB8_9CHLO|nr:hypothetical protein CYMTET_51730 [Cymbomonas tetramitiformis]
MAASLGAARRCSQNSTATTSVRRVELCSLEARAQGQRRHIAFSKQPKLTPQHMDRGSARRNLQILRESTTVTVAQVNSGSTSVVPAEPLSFSFSASGLLFPYYIGVIEVLLDAGLITDETHIAGTSGGGLVSACIANGVQPQQLLDTVCMLYENLRDYGSPLDAFAGRLEGPLRLALASLLPTDAHLGAAGRTSISVTQMWPPPMSGDIVTSWSSKADLIDCIVASCYLPGFLGSKPAANFRERPCWDGGMIRENILPPAATSTTVNISAFPSDTFETFGLNERVQIYPNIVPENFPYAALDYMKWIGVPPDQAEIAALYTLGRDSAKHWLSQPSSNDLVGMAK